MSERKLVQHVLNCRQIIALIRGKPVHNVCQKNKRPRTGPCVLLDRKITAWRNRRGAEAMGLAKHAAFQLAQTPEMIERQSHDVIYLRLLHMCHWLKSQTC